MVIFIHLFIHSFTQSSLHLLGPGMAAGDLHLAPSSTDSRGISRVNPLLFRSLLTVHFYVSFGHPLFSSPKVSTVRLFWEESWMAYGRHVPPTTPGSSLQWCSSLSWSVHLHWWLNLATQLLGFTWSFYFEDLKLSLKCDTGLPALWSVQEDTKGCALENPDLGVEAETSRSPNWLGKLCRFWCSSHRCSYSLLSSFCQGEQTPSPHINCDRNVGSSGLAQDLCLLLVSLEFSGASSLAAFLCLLLYILVSVSVALDHQHSSSPLRLCSFSLDDILRESVNCKENCQLVVVDYLALKVLV